MYLPQALLDPPDHPRQKRHQNLSGTRIIARALADRGYAVDVVHKADTLFRPHGSYDLVISERLDWGAALPLFDDCPVWAYLATTTEHRAHNAALRERHRALERRRGRDLAAHQIYDEDIPALEHSEVLIGVGNETVMGTWRARFAGPILAFDNFADDSTRSSLPGKVFEDARRHFFFFASSRQVLKGLDLCLEAFSRRDDLHLHVCSGYESERDFCALYRTELQESANIHPRGWVEVGGAEFERITRTCATVLLPSCSEGQAGSVVHCMAAGLTPMVTPQTGLDLEDFGVMLAGDGVDALEAAVGEHAARPASWHAERAERTRRHALSFHSESRFRERFGEIVDELDRRVGARS